MIKALLSLSAIVLWSKFSVHTMSSAVCREMWETAWSVEISWKVRVVSVSLWLECPESRRAMTEKSWHLQPTPKQVSGGEEREKRERGAESETETYHGERFQYHCFCLNYFLFGRCGNNCNRASKCHVLQKKKKQQTNSTTSTVSWHVMLLLCFFERY